MLAVSQVPSPESSAKSLLPLIDNVANIPSSEAVIAEWIRTAWVIAMEPRAKRKTKITRDNLER